jgi:putative Mg2+ transporter-C (MgtC) family protein
MTDLFGPDWPQVLTFLFKFLVALALAIPVAWERESANRIMGLRTFPLVSVGSCGYVLITSVLASENVDSQARLLQGLISGLGFIGGGAIIKHENNVQGTATAASIWITGALGAAVGHGYYGIAVIISALTFLALILLSPLKDRLAADGQSESSDG